MVSTEKYKRKIAWNKGLPKENQPCFGKRNSLGKHWKLSETIKAKMSEAQKGRKFSEIHKKKLSEIHKILWKNIEYRNAMIKSHIGYIFSEEHKNNLRNSLKGKISPMKGKKHTEKTKQKMRDSHPKGENSPVWKGELRKKKEERNDSLYQYWILQVKKRDNNQCLFKGQNCSGYNVVHHILPWRDYPELRYNINNGITLCQYHHPRKRVEEQRLIPFFQEMIKSKVSF